MLDWELHRDHKKNGKLSVRDPYKIDENLINYQLDSEDEWAEENGEDINDDDKEEESDEEQDDDNGFIVDDGYLSMSEMMDSDDDQVESREERRKALMEK